MGIEISFGGVVEGGMFRGLEIIFFGMSFINSFVFRFFYFEKERVIFRKSFFDYVNREEKMMI